MLERRDASGKIERRFTNITEDEKLAGYPRDWTMVAWNVKRREEDPV